jgi:hypothetical protein
VGSAHVIEEAAAIGELLVRHAIAGVQISERLA